MSILGVDFGTKNIGLAIWREGADLVLPFGLLKNDASALKKLATLAREEKIEKIVLGLPLGLDKKENANTQKIRAFAQELEKLSEVKTEFFSEIFSSQMADRSAGGASRDEKSAMIILQDFLKKEGL